MSSYFSNLIHSFYKVSEAFFNQINTGSNYNYEIDTYCTNDYGTNDYDTNDYDTNDYDAETFIDILFYDLTYMINKMFDIS